jgi:hypothetical protein
MDTTDNTDTIDARDHPDSRDPADPYTASAHAYAAGVRSIFAPAAPALGAPDRVERGDASTRGLPAAPEDLAGQAEQLAPISSDLTRAAGARLADPDPVVRAQASTALLAKALTDLEVGAYLLEAAQDEEAGLPPAPAAPGAPRATRAAGPPLERVDRAGPATRSGVEERLAIILGDVGDLGDLQPAREAAVQRGVEPFADLAAARADLADAVEDALTAIAERASQASKGAFDGLLGLGAGELARVAGVVGAGIAEALGQAERLTRLYQLVRDFVLRASEAVIALLGQHVAQTAAGQVTKWVDALRNGELLDDLLARLYDTGRGAEALRAYVATCDADLAAFHAASRQVSGLGEQFRKQTDLAGKLLRGLGFVAAVPVTVLPHGKLIVSALYVAIGAYVVLTGADYVDAPHLRLLDRVPGVRQTVETCLPRRP